MSTDAAFWSLIKEITPKHNEATAQGIAVQQMKTVSQYMDHVWECAAKSFPPGLVYEGSAWCSPEEEYATVIKPRYGNGKGTFELAPSDLTLRKYQTSWMGEKLPVRPLYLPHVAKGGLLRLRGPVYTISPVLADIALSPTKNGVFIALTRDRLTFERLPYSYVADGKIHNSYVVWSAVHSSSEKNPKKIAMMSTMVHYLFCKYGVTEAFRRYCGADVAVFRRDDERLQNLGDNWVKCTSTGMTPKVHARRAYRSASAVLAIPKDQYTPLAALFIAGFFYVVDHFPERFNPEYMDSDRYWRILMGHVIYRNGTNEGKLATDVDTHMASLDNYVDQMVRESLRKGGIDCDDRYDIYDLFAYIVANISDIVMNADLASMYNKQLFVLRYVMIKLRSQIFLMTYKLNGNNKKQLTKKDVIKIMGQFLNRDLIFDLTKDHGEVSIIQAPGSCMLLKHTSNLVLQADATGRRGRRNKGNVNDASRILHASIAEVASIFNLPKSDPSGRTKLSPYVKTDSDGAIMPDPAKAEIISKLQKLIQR